MQALSTGDVAAVLQVSRDTVRRLCEAGQLDYARVSGQRGWMRVYRDSIDEYAKRNNIRLKWDAIDSGKK